MQQCRLQTDVWCDIGGSTDGRRADDDGEADAVAVKAPTDTRCSDGDGAEDDRGKGGPRRRAPVE